MHHLLSSFSIHNFHSRLKSLAAQIFPSTVQWCTQNFFQDPSGLFMIPVLISVISAADAASFNFSHSTLLGPRLTWE